MSDSRHKTDFFDLSREELARFLKERFDAPAYRATQLFKWIYQRGLRDFSLMSDITKGLRQEFAGVFVLPALAAETCELSRDGTRKYLFRLADGKLVETVMIKQPSRMTLCVSTQVGCGMGCTFCRTGTMKFVRNLRAAEIVGQVLAVLEDSRRFGDTFSNIVFMGMGEPLHNYVNVVRSARILTDHNGLKIAPRKITVSTSGLVPRIEKFMQEGLDLSLAVSLNATTDEVRSQIMPVNRRYPLEDLLRCLRELPLKRRRKITMEYVLIDGVNDSDADLKRLPRLLHGIPVKLNLIPYNENAGLGFGAPGRDKLMRWQDTLVKKGINATIRWSKGTDIRAACGQLATKSAPTPPG